MIILIVRIIMEKLTHVINEDDIYKHLPYGYTWHNSGLIYAIDQETLQHFAPMLNSAITLKYGWRRIGVHPLERFYDLLNARIIELVNKYGPLIQKAFINEGVNIHDGGSIGVIEKDVNSEFPNNAINPSEESYASDSHDHVSKTHNTLGQLQANKLYNDPNNPFIEPITAILEQLNSLFSQLIY